jgi:hypothetical protein
LFMWVSSEKRHPACLKKKMNNRLRFSSRDHHG